MQPGCDGFGVPLPCEVSEKYCNFARTMNWTVIIIETLGMTAAFTALCL